MRRKRLFTICVLVIALLVVLCACGSKSDTQAANEAQAASQSEQEAAIQAQTNQQATVEVVVPTANAAATVDDLLGSWTDINSPDRFANVTKVESSYQFEDNDGKCLGDFKDGILKIKVSDGDGDTADAYFDAKTGHMFLEYKGDISEFKKK